MVPPLSPCVFASYRSFTTDIYYPIVTPQASRNRLLSPACPSSRINRFYTSSHEEGRTEATNTRHSVMIGFSGVAGISALGSRSWGFRRCSFDRWAAFPWQRSPSCASDPRDAVRAQGHIKALPREVNRTAHRGDRAPDGIARLGPRDFPVYAGSFQGSAPTRRGCRLARNLRSL